MFRTRVEAGHRDLQDLLGPRLLARARTRSPNIKEKMIMILVELEWRLICLKSRVRFTKVEHQSGTLSIR